MAKFIALALFGLLAAACVSSAIAAKYDQVIPPGANCNKSCYNKRGLLPTKKILFRLCKVSGVKIISTTPPPIANMRTFCLTYIYHAFPTPAAMVKYQNCEANQALYIKNMLKIKAPGSFWANSGKPPKFSACRARVG